CNLLPESAAWDSGSSEPAGTAQADACRGGAPPVGSPRNTHRPAYVVGTGLTFPFTATKASGEQEARGAPGRFPLQPPLVAAAPGTTRASAGTPARSSVGSCGSLRRTVGQRQGSPGQGQAGPGRGRFPHRANRCCAGGGGPSILGYRLMRAR